MGLLSTRVMRVGTGLPERTSSTWKDCSGTMQRWPASQASRNAVPVVRAIDLGGDQLEGAQAAVRRGLDPARHQAKACRHQNALYGQCGRSFFRSCKRTP